MIGIWIGDQRHHQLAEDRAMAQAILKMIGRKKLAGKLVRFVTEPAMHSPSRGTVHRVQVGPRYGCTLKRAC